MTAAHWNAFVDAFDVKGFANQMAEGKVGWVMFCIDDCLFGWQCAPNKTFNRYTGYASGQRCSKRDLILDLAKALHKKGIRLILYYGAMSGYTSDLQSLSGTSDDNDSHTPPSAESRSKHVAILKEYCKRYKNKIDGWWFDRFDAAQGYAEPPNDYQTIAALVHSANPRSIIAFSGVDEFGCHRPGVDDYTAGDTWWKQDLKGLTPETKPAGGGIVWHGKIFCGNIYHGQGTANRYSDQDLIDWVTTCNGQGGVVTMDWPFDPKTGLLKNFGLAQLKRIARAVK